jgi:4-amino-4-deoxy-L-arabinose transferase-like glycosyltransferase
MERSLRSRWPVFATIAIVFAQLARKHPPWWIGVAVACWLGSLQKIPLIIVVWLAIVLVRLASKNERSMVLNCWLFCSLIFAVTAAAIWPLLQLIRYQMPWRQVFHQEIVVFFGPERLGARPYLEVPFRLATTAWIGGGLFAVVALFVVLLWGKQRFSGATRELAILCVALIALAVLFNFRSGRYIVPIVPCLCLLLAVVFHRFFEQRSPVHIAAVVLLAIVLVTGVAQAEIQIYLRQRNASLQIVHGKIKLRSAEKNIA